MNRSGIALQGSDSRFGIARSSDFWLDNVNCTGNELYIDDCNHNGWGRHDCSASEAAKVICKGKYQRPASTYTRPASVHHTSRPCQWFALSIDLTVF